MIVSCSPNNTLTLNQSMIKDMLPLSLHSSLILYLENCICRSGRETNTVPHFSILQMRHLCICWVVVMYSCLRWKPLRKISTPGSLARLYREVGLIPRYSLYLKRPNRNDKHCYKDSASPLIPINSVCQAEKSFCSQRLQQLGSTDLICMQKLLVYWS